MVGPLQGHVHSVPVSIRLGAPKARRVTADVSLARRRFVCPRRRFGLPIWHQRGGDRERSAAPESISVSCILRQPTAPRRMRQRRRGPPRRAASHGWKCSDTALPGCQSDLRGLAATYVAALILLYLATGIALARRSHCATPFMLRFWTCADASSTSPSRWRRT